MSEEEKEAIDKLKRSANYFVMPIYETTIILNLIEKQQKEIENLKEQKCEWFELYNSRVFDIIKLEQEVEELKEINEEHQKLNGELRDEIERQGNTREIEEKYIEENFISKDWC